LCLGSFFINPFSLKGHGNEADFLGFLQKLGPHRSLTQPFEPFRFWLRIRRDIPNRKTTRRVGEPAFECLKGNSASQESLTPRIGESESHHGESGSRYSNFLNLAKIFRTLNGYTSPLKDQFGEKEARDVMYYHH
jgi:hypothetical protein